MTGALCSENQKNFMEVSNFSFVSKLIFVEDAVRFQHFSYLSKLMSSLSEAFQSYNLPLSILSSETAASLYQNCHSGRQCGKINGRSAET